MKRKRISILMVIFILVLSTLACGIFNGDDETTDGSAPPDQSTESTSAGDSQEQQPLEEQPSSDKLAEGSESPLSPQIKLKDDYRSEAGGYAFQPIAGYEFEEFFGLTAMSAPDADPDLGPMLMLIGGTNEEEATSDEIFDNFLKDAEKEDVEILEQKEINVDGKPGLLADIAGTVEGKQIVGRIVVVAVTPTQQFTLFASAPQDRWDSFAASFDAVLGSVYFFEPQDIDFSKEIEEVVPDDGLSSDDASGEDITLDIASLEEFPTEASQLPPGGFAYLLASSEGFPTIVSQGSIQDQSTSAEYVIGLVSEDQGSSLTLFLPFDVGQGVYPMSHYDSSAATKAPGAAVYKGTTLYTNTDGIIMIDTAIDNTITGSVYFTAVDESGNEIAVTGFFNALPLAAP